MPRAAKTKVQSIAIIGQHAVAMPLHLQRVQYQFIDTIENQYFKYQDQSTYYDQ